MPHKTQADSHAHTHILAYTQAQHQSEIFRIKGSLLARMKDTKAAHQCFFQSLYLWKQSAEAWLAWGKLCDELWDKGAASGVLTTELLEYAVHCILQVCVWVGVPDCVCGWLYVRPRACAPLSCWSTRCTASARCRCVCARVCACVYACVHAHQVEAALPAYGLTKASCAAAPGHSLPPVVCMKSSEVVVCGCIKYCVSACT